MQRSRLTQLIDLWTRIRTLKDRRGRIPDGHREVRADRCRRVPTQGAHEDRPQDLCQLNRMGDLLARAGRIGPGIALFERVAHAYAEDGFWAKAIAIYRKILRYDPSRSDIETRLAFLYQRSGLPVTT